MHGLIFETSIWLLAGSTRYLAVQYGQTKTGARSSGSDREMPTPHLGYADIPVTLLLCGEPTSRSAEKNFSQTTKRPSRPSMINTRMSASSCRTENEVSHETKVQAEKIWNLLLDARAPSSLFTLSPEIREVRSSSSAVRAPQENSTGQLSLNRRSDSRSPGRPLCRFIFSSPTLVWRRSTSTRSLERITAP